MAGLGVWLDTDEMIDPELALALRLQQYDALSCHEVGRGNRTIPDGDHLEYAAADRRAMLTNNMGDFIALDARWKATGRRHAGIILVARAQPLGHFIRCTARHLETVPPEVQDDTLLWLDTSAFD